jgi:hypothetical protein
MTTYAHLAYRDQLTKAVLEQKPAGVSTRRFAGTPEAGRPGRSVTPSAQFEIGDQPLSSSAGPARTRGR